MSSRKKIMITMNEKLLDRVDKICEDFEMNRSDFLEQLCAYAMNKFDEGKLHGNWSRLVIY